MTDRVDNFNRADSTTALGTPSDAAGDWVAQSGTWGISSNTAYLVSSASNASAVLESSVSNVTASVKLATASTFVGLVARAADNSNYILAIFNKTDTQVLLYKRVAGSFTQLGSTVFGVTINNGDTVSLTIDSANLIDAKVNGSSKITFTDSAGSTNTKCGIWSSTDTVSRFDDFAITGLDAPTGQPTMRRWGGVPGMNNSGFGRSW